MRPTGAVRIGAGRPGQVIALRVDGPVLEHVPHRLERLARRAEQVCVVAVRKDRAAPVHDLVEGARHAHLQALHRAPERDSVRSLYDQVDVVALDREVDEAEAETLASPRECALDGAETAVGAEIPDFPAHAQGDMKRSATEFRARRVRNVLARRSSLPACAAAGATPERKSEVLLDKRGV
jgi:hypothetical protein